MWDFAIVLGLKCGKAYNVIWNVSRTAKVE